MTEGIYALAGVALGAVLGLVTNAVIERWRHSYIRNDARTDRYAATLREAIDAYSEFVLAWSTASNNIALGGKVDLLDPAIISGPPGIAHRRLTGVTERIHVESIRLRLGDFLERVMTDIANGTVTAVSIDLAGQFGTEIAADIGTELRKLEAL
jgi:hypothetical protein